MIGRNPDGPIIDDFCRGIGESVSRGVFIHDCHSLDGQEHTSEPSEVHCLLATAFEIARASNRCCVTSSSDRDCKNAYLHSGTRFGDFSGHMHGLEVDRLLTIRSEVDNRSSMRPDQAPLRLAQPLLGRNLSFRF